MSLSSIKLFNIDNPKGKFAFPLIVDGVNLFTENKRSSLYVRMLSRFMMGNAANDFSGCSVIIDGQVLSLNDVWKHLSPEDGFVFSFSQCEGILNIYSPETIYPAEAA